MQEYNKADQWLHSLSQVMARAQRTFVPEKDDDSHTNFYFDALGYRIVGRWLHWNGAEMLLALNLPGLVLEFFDSGLQKVAEVKAVGKSLPEFEQDVLAGFKHLGWPLDGLLDPLHYQIPNYGFEGLPIPVLSPEALLIWRQYRQMANEACAGLLGHLQREAEVRIWPHHFDTGIYFKAFGRLNFGFGLAMQDAIVGSPYFYFSAYGLNGSPITVAAMEPLQDGHWVDQDWKGAVLPLDGIHRNTLDRFILEVVNHYVLTTDGGPS